MTPRNCMNSLGKCSLFTVMDSGTGWSVVLQTVRKSLTRKKYCQLIINKYLFIANEVMYEQF